MAPATIARKVVCLLVRQVSEIREGGPRVFLRKGHNLLLRVLMVPILLVVRALRPVVLIRFGMLASPRIGHFAANTELYLCERDVGLQNNRAIDIFYLDPTFVCNTQLKRMWHRVLHVSYFARPLQRLCRCLPGYEKHVIPMPSDMDVHGLLYRMRAHLSFTPKEEQLGRAGIRDLGIPEGVPYVCLYARDSAYLDTLHTYYPREHWRYHDYRDSDILNYIPAAEEIVHRGCYVVRMGAVVQKPLPCASPQIIDYAVNGRTDFLDIFLSAKCRFFVGSTGGITAIPRVFRRPVVYVNFVPLGAEHMLTCGSDSLVIPKKLWLRQEGRFMTFREILDSGAGGILRTDQYERLGVEIVENAPQEIAALAVEMDERLNGTWKTTEEDEELQRRFRSLFKLENLCGGRPARIGAEFLRQHRDLLN